MTMRCLLRLNPILVVLLVCVAAIFPFAYPIDALAAARAKPKPPPEPPASYPPARAWHALTDNGSTVGDTSRVYMLGGAGADYSALDDFWYYDASAGRWVLAPTGSAKPGSRQHAALSCGAGECVTASGTNGLSLLRETWVYTESTAVWSKLNCRRQLCPGPSAMVAMAYDPARFQHVMFGGHSQYDEDLDDTYVFAGGLWTQAAPDDSPSRRRLASMTFVSAPVNRLVLFGGLEAYVQALCDVWAWTGSDWQEVSTGGDGPCLHSHSMAWDGAQLVIAGGYEDASDSPNQRVWSFRFDSPTSGRWSEVSPKLTCNGVIRPGSRMALDRPTRSMVFFGGEENRPGGVVRFDDTAVCR